MRLAKGVKLNVIVAILLCIAFVLNVGSTFAAVRYNYLATSIGDSQTETYTGYGFMQADSGKYAYSVGSVNNSLGLNYGFSTNYDIAVKFKATYKNAAHKANDFELNFVNRDQWCIDMGAENDIKNSATSYYQLTSTSNTLEGMMYYLGTKTGSGRLPIISGVTFYTSNSHSYEVSAEDDVVSITSITNYATYEGDELTIELTPIYVKSGTYTSSHKFYSHKLQGSLGTVLNNWKVYMDNLSKTGETFFVNNIFMVYNAYGTVDRGLQMPADALSMTTNGNNVSIDMPSSPLTNPNTAYRYKVVRTVKPGTEADPEYIYPTTYDNVAAGNKYYGGLGVFVIPSETIKSITVTFAYEWFDPITNQSVGSPNNPIKYKFSTTDMEEVKVDSSTTYYSKINLSKPTYINVLEYFMMTASSGFRAAMYNGYRMVVHTVTIVPQYSVPSSVNISNRASYTINNSSEKSGILIEQKNWAGGSTAVETDVTIHNTSDETLAIDTFTVKGTLWHSSYDGNNSAWSEAETGTYLTPEYGANGSTISKACIDYDANLWELTKYEDSTYTFKRKGVNYVPSGYAMTLLTGVTVAEQDYPTYPGGYTEENDQEVAYVYDLWCKLEVTVTFASNETTSLQENYTGLEVSTNGYYSKITSSSPAEVYVRNNTNQNVYNVQLSLTLYPAPADKPLRNNISTLNGTVSYTTTNYASNYGTSKIVLRPNEKKLLFVITPTADAIIYNYTVTAKLEAGVVSGQVDRVINEENGTVGLVNNTQDLYEFRLKSTKDLTSMVSEGFVVGNVLGTNDALTASYAYYKGVICPNQVLEVLTEIGTNFDVEVEIVQHTQGWDHTHYVAGNYSAWADDTSGAMSTWLTIMASIYDNTLSKNYFDVYDFMNFYNTYGNQNHQMTWNGSELSYGALTGYGDFKGSGQNGLLLYSLPLSAGTYKLSCYSKHTRTDNVTTTGIGVAFIRNDGTQVGYDYNSTYSDVNIEVSHINHIAANSSSYKYKDTTFTITNAQVEAFRLYIVYNMENVSSFKNIQITKIS